ncbi:MAG TPA: 50S ribosomal protein L18 [Candidatus Saccharimonadales bacterium]|nr:50S ribosomal protein L18 [Candidatus Saccharimonadales bacterium]
MAKQTLKARNFTQRAARVRATVSGTTARPRLSVHVSNLHVSAQIINDETHQTLAAVSTVGQKSVKGSLTEKATWVGTEIAGKAKAAKVKQVVFDRRGKLYHGRVKALADAARNAGLEF